MNVSLLTIGDEICIGQIVNTNSAWIAEQLTAIGAEVKIHIAVGDNSKDMTEQLSYALGMTEMVIITGGLGPTHDDITKPVLTDYFNDKLVFDEESYKNILNFLYHRGITPTERNRNLAYLPSKCTPLFNAVGTAPGMLFEENGKYIISLPGVPAEMKYIMINSVIPFIKRIIVSRKDNVVLYKTLHTRGIPESLLAEKIGNVNEFLQSGTLAFLPSSKGVRLRIGVVGEDFEHNEREIERIETILRQKVGQFMFSSKNETLALVTGNLLTARNETIAVAESCTGGMLGAEFTANPGSSIYFYGGVIAYDNSIKENILGVNRTVLDRFGAVSSETAETMAKSIRNIFHTTYGISITGIAGPDGGTEEKPVGTVWIALATPDKVQAQKFFFGQDRETTRQKSVFSAINMLYEVLNNNELQ